MRGLAKELPDLARCGIVGNADDPASSLLDIVVRPTRALDKPAGQDKAGGAYVPAGLHHPYANFYIDTARYELAGGIESLCDTYGPERLLFSSGFPRSNVGGPLLTLMHANIKDTEREAIASGNLDRLLGGVWL